ncbi:MAG: 16S rRNA (adenine(1518)-N(6)/adenine(1519)-N(6))-dimethyltransferase RsmA [Corynebacterium sp.]|uniref:16S rRNA (adenine(1518)-N(6)/adenine(1519)-N(6))- dimethyltransferase RsmA n=1 Tax=Corynebacterium TaxID=1716 RepID=UPI002649C6CB|nr:16S rRNA (adenine(1518)-N(6)/adenine(1519)-N(6))-dimethyltransferase RsmA [Corynebacterium sp.]MDN5724115.1 16S rRNA (adenine(1518)-N(6)/adenine(1519)-N(6))-dimethyltransferase RsmA [Corynebacterium sp.]MDN6281662.1 16S rRNA (adenine(1518)-N(6)/adenine(1519)-N(6))-dimethyltransferase RsmA [Corynebacterium sp.]MDN6305046.1 16S rRNA (adenine(1518)-N(6)/adenine(1519)-N(6))-dimethyltransferase RsmA [Corynebacterium sp.]MDN6352206.1 16S rRNA (adenine(1518)-N(6)/adenine(1519)-N(6))-dimethyltransfe
MLGPGEIRELAAELDVTPTKRLGQNFVIDPNTVRRIVTAADLAEDDHVVEVGPGLGSLTLALLEAVGQLTVVEIDPRLAGRLERTVGEFAPSRADDLTVVTSDALKIAADNPAFVDTPPTALVANLPYNVSVPVLLHLLEIFPSIRRVLVMVQLEVADRLAADPGSKVYGVPSVKAGFYGRVRRAGVIGKNVFWPAPKIDSGLVRIDRWADEDRPWQTELERLGEDVLRSELFAVTDAAFLQRRKTLRAALSGYFGSGPEAEEVLTAAGIDPRERGEKLDTAAFVRLAVASLDRRGSS